MDPYEILGVPRGCTREEAREAFRAKALAAHPDRGGEEGAFIRIRTAYEQVVAELGRWALEQASPRRAWAAPADDGRSKPVTLVTEPRPARSEDPEGIRFLDDDDIRYIEDTPDAFATRERYLAWVDRIAAKTERKELRSREKSARWLAVAFVLCMLLVPMVLVIGNAVAELPEIVTLRERGGLPADAVAVLYALAYLGSPVLALWIAWKCREH